MVADSRKQIPVREGLWSAPESPGEPPYLIGSRCPSCGEVVFPANRVCVNCQNQNMEEINSIMQFAQIAQSVGPQGQMAVKVDEMLDLIAEKLGVPQKIRTTREERMMAMENAAQAAEQMAAQNPEAAAQVVSQLA